MALSTYAELQAAIADWLDRSDLTTQIVDFITLAEAVIRRNVNFMGDETEATLVTVADQEWVDLPADYNGLRNAYVEKDSYRVQLPQKSIARLHEDYLGRGGDPCAYAIAADKLFLGPIPGGIQNVYIKYYAFLDLATNLTNPVLQKYPDLYLRLAMVEASRFLHDKDGTQYWETLANESMSQIDDHQDRLRFNETDIVMSSPFVE